MEDREQQERVTSNPHDSRPQYLLRYAEDYRDVLHLYEEDLQAIWDNVALMIGPYTVMVMMQSAMATAKRIMPLAGCFRYRP